MTYQNIISLLSAFVCIFHLNAQVNVSLPQVITPTNRIYLSTLGNDSNVGTINSPKKTFQSALAAFPFGVSGINNSQSYNEIIFLAGDYFPTQTLSQNPSQFLLEQNGIKMYKNVSVRGIGNVVIHGDNAINVGYSALMALMGSHISVRNMQLLNSQYGGIKFIGGNKHCTNILVDSLTVDDAPSHGCLFVLADTIWVKNSIVRNTCNENSDENASNCQWGSALKTEYCRDITFEKNQVYRNWGEGINTSLSERIRCSHNIAYDNYSVNFYLHSAAKGVWEGNLVYNEDSAFWRSCYNNGKRYPPGGFSIANELTCTDNCLSGGNNQNCGGKYHCCAYTAYDAIGYQSYPYRQTDSIFVYNNVLLAADVNIWDAFSGFLKYGFLKDIYVENNTLVGLAGRKTDNKTPVKVTLGTPFVYAQNIVIQNNIFTQDTLLTAMKKGINVYIPSGVCNGLSDGNIVSLSHNLWNTPKISTNSAINISTEQVLATLPTQILPTQIIDLIPNAQHPYWVQASNHASYITKDFYGNARFVSSNVGAFEKNSSTEIVENKQDIQFVLFPNPTKSSFFIESTNAVSYQVQVFDMKGVLQKTIQNAKNGQTISLEACPDGIYVVSIIGEDNRQILRKLVLLR